MSEVGCCLSIKETLCNMPLCAAFGGTWHRAERRTARTAAAGTQARSLWEPTQSPGLPFCCFPCPQVRVLGTLRSGAGKGNPRQLDGKPQTGPFPCLLGTWDAPAVLRLGS